VYDAVHAFARFLHCFFIPYIYFGNLYFAFDFFEPHWAKSLAVRAEVIQAWFGYLDEKEFPQVKTANPRESYNNSFVDNLEKAGFFEKIGWAR